MKVSHIITLSLLSALAGIAFLAYEHEWIIIRSPWNRSEHASTPGLSKQKITFSYWREHAWKEETKELIITDDPEKKAATIIANWLTMLHEEKIIKEKVALESALLDPGFANPVYALGATPRHAGPSLPAIAQKSDGWEARLATPGAAHKARLYISFDQTPFRANQSTHEKWMFIQGLMRTLKGNGVEIQGIYFLVNHAPLQDDQLDFTNAWPA